MQLGHIFNACVRAMQFHCCAETLQKEKGEDHYEKKIATIDATPTTAFSDVHVNVIYRYNISYFIRTSEINSKTLCDILHYPK